MYVIVDDLQQSMAACERLGGQVIIRDRDLGHQGRMSLLQDPVGAFLAIVQLPPE